MEKVLIVICTTKIESMSLASEVSDFLNSKNFETDFVHFEGFSEDSSFEGYSFVVTLGGDGTVLYAARNCVELNIPVFAVNLGEFGFLANIEVEDWKKELSAFIQTKLQVNIDQ